MFARKSWVLPLAAAALAACVQDTGPLGPGEGPGAATDLQAALSCEVDIRGGTLSCTLPEGESGTAAGAIIGGQDEFVLLESSGVSYDPADPDGPVFKANVAIRNFLTQAIGTTDGITPDPDGIRIFFHTAPQVTEGSGSITVRNPDGTGSFSGSDQPYFQYNAILAPGEGTGNKSWQWDVPETVVRFSFHVGVSASVIDEGALEAAPKLIASTLAVGHNHNCALDSDGRAFCWGLNDVGQLGIGVPVAERSVPTMVNTGLTFTMISAGENHTCAVSTENDAYCWGAGANNRLGIGTTDDYFSPAPVVGDVKFQEVKAGSTHSCGVSLAGDIYCWGGNGNAKTSQGTTTGSTASPSLIRGGGKYKSVSAGYFQSCAITIDDTAVCWGNSNTGRLGIGDTTGNIHDPTPIDVSEKFASIVTGSAYSCALTTGGDAYCWGSHTAGKLGIGEVEAQVNSPALVNGGHKFTSIDARFAHTCATKANGEAWCWGNNDWGRLGTGNTANQIEPVKVEAEIEFSWVGVGRYHTCGIDTDGAIYCWGRNDNASQLGTGRPGARYLPAPVSIPVPPPLPQPLL